MRELNEAIMKHGRALGNDVVKVDMFLNHRIDTRLMVLMAQELSSHFASEKPTVILTVEASGIALAVLTAHEMGDIPVVFAKKGATVVQNEEMAQAPVYSFTHKMQNIIRVDKRYLPKGSRVLVVDDFLADGQAALGMAALCEQMECELIGVGIGVEKGFMSGSKKLREKGIKLKSLAVVQSIADGKITLSND